MKQIIRTYDASVSVVRHMEWLPLLALRIYLAPVFIMAGSNKLSDPQSTAYYFGEILGLPLPQLMVWLAGSAELAGGIALLTGLGVRLFSIPLMVTMLVAIFSAHWDNGWHVLPESTLTVPWEWRRDLIEQAVQRRDMARELLREYGNYQWLTEAGPVTVLKNGIEFAATYLIMLMVLLSRGGGAYASIDYWLKKWLSAATSR